MSSYRLGFLLCDRPLDHLADRFGDYPAMFEAAFGAVTDALDWQVYPVTEHVLPDDVAACDGYLISGSRHGVYEDHDWLAPLHDFVRAATAAGRPTVGLCFGHQVLGHALGGLVAKADQGWGIGLHEYHITATRPWMRDAGAAFTIPVCHQDQVLSLPPGAEVLAGNDHCRNFFVQFAPSAVGLQGHPEFAPEFLAELIAWRGESLPPAVRDTASASLTRVHDNLAVRRWLMEFLGVPLTPEPAA